LNLGDLILVRGTNCIDKGIEGITHSPYSHAAGIVKENELIEAQGFRKTGYQGLDFYSGHADLYTCDALTDEQRHKIVDYVAAEVGSHYDYLLIVWEAIYHLFHWFLPYKEVNKRICSTLWSDAYLAAGVNLCPGIRYPTPGDLAKSPLLRKIDGI
jgi:hypothetical protein